MSLKDHSEVRGKARNRLMSIPYGEEKLQDLFKVDLTDPRNTIRKDVFQDGKKRIVSDICYNIIEFNNFTYLTICLTPIGGASLIPSMSRD